MSTAIPPTAAIPPAPAPATAPTVSVAEPPAALLRLPAGSLIAAVVAEANAGGEVNLQTAYGLLRATARLPLPPHGELQLQVRTPATPLLLNILTLNGRQPAAATRPPAAAPAPPGTPPPPAAAASPQFAPVSPNAPLPAARAAAPVQLATGTTLTATVLRPATGPTPATTPSALVQGTTTPTAATATAAPSTPILAAGTQLTLRIAAAPPGGPTTPTASTAPSGQTTVWSKTASAQAPTPTPTVQPRSVPVSTGPTTTGTMATGTTLTAVVTGATRAGQPIVQTQLGMLVLETRAPMATGTTVNLTVTEPPQPPPPSLSGFSHLLGATGNDPRSWPTMEEAMKALTAADPQVAQQVSRTVLPQPDSRLAAMLLNFIAALRGGDVSGWLGDGPSRLLQRVKPSLAGALGEEFRQASRVANEPAGGDWRLFVLPFADDQQIRPIRLMLRQRSGDSRGDGDGSADREGTRFVFDIDTTRLGRMQLDGLVRNKNKRFDLIIRTAGPMPAEMRTDIHRIFADANAITGITGSVGFQSDPPGFVDLPPEAFVDDPLGLTV